MKSLKLLSKLIVLTFIIAFILLYSFGPYVNLEHEILLLICNLLFTGLVPITVSIISSRTYLKTNIKGALLLSCGMLVFGLGSIATGILRFTPDSANVSLTVYNICAFAGSAFHLFLTYSEVRFNALKRHEQGSMAKLSISIAAICLFVFLIIYASITGLTPPFIDKSGVTEIRNLILSVTIAFYFAASLSFGKQYKACRQDYLYWYSFSLLMISLGFIGVLDAKSLGTPLGWAGRLAQYIGAIFALVSMLDVFVRAKNKNTTITEIMTNFFSDALKENELMMRTIMESASDFMFIKDRQSRVVIVNQAYEKAFGVTISDVIGKNDYELYTDRELARKVIENDQQVMTSGSIHTFEESVQTLDGYKTYSISKVPWRDTDGGIIGVLGIAHDVTELKNREAELKFIKDDLAVEVEKALELAEELKRADNNKNEFISALSHELRNPLATIVAGLSLIDFSKNPEQIIRVKGIIQHQVDQLCRLVDDLLDLTRITRNKIELKKQRIEINKIASLAAESQRTLFNEKGVKLVIEVTEDEIYMDADPVRITQIVGNLLNNALKFSKNGGTVILSVIKGVNEVALTVKDDGIGIMPEFLPSLFEPFMQADNSIDRRNGGLGLGLSIVKGIAELHRGSVSANSEGSGKGSEFVIRLPVPQIVNQGEMSQWSRQTVH